jgi:hypothetical protein
MAGTVEVTAPKPPVLVGVSPGNRPTEVQPRARSAADARIVSCFNRVQKAMLVSFRPPADRRIWSAQIGRVGEVVGFGPELQRDLLWEIEVLKD